MLAFASAACVLEDAAAKVTEDVLIMQQRTSRAVARTREAGEVIAAALAGRGAVTRARSVSCIE
jgi:hypothetical protein